MTNDEKWFRNYELLKAYIAEHHHLPDKKKEENRGLLNWAKYQRKRIRMNTLDAGKVRLFSELMDTRSTEHTGGRKAAPKTGDSRKAQKYAALLPAVRSLLDGEQDEIAGMANLAAVLHREFGFWWTGFYRVNGSAEELVLGPFQGPVACARIPYGKGVCGTAWAENRTVIVPDVGHFPGHIACSSESRSEIVVPVRDCGRVVAVLDIDSRELGTFDEVDALWLERMVECIGMDGQRLLRDIWFAAGCFWGAQKFFKMIEGVEFTEVGFANGQTADPTYNEVYTDATGHAECVHVRYNPAIVPLSKLVRMYFRIIDPLGLNRQGEDEGTRYRTGVYYADERDYALLREEFSRVERDLGSPLAVELERLICFYPADEYHQNYLDKNPGGYCHINPELFKLATTGKLF